MALNLFIQSFFVIFTNFAYDAADLGNKNTNYTSNERYYPWLFLEFSSFEITSEKVEKSGFENSIFIGDGRKHLPFVLKGLRTPASSAFHHLKSSRWHINAVIQLGWNPKADTSKCNSSFRKKDAKKDKKILFGLLSVELYIAKKYGYSSTKCLFLSFSYLF